MYDAIKGFPTILVNGISQLVAFFPCKILLAYSGDFNSFCVIREISYTPLIMSDI